MGNNVLSVSNAQHINFISPQTVQNGEPKVLKSGSPGNSVKCGVCRGFLQKTTVRGEFPQPDPGNSGKFIWGAPFW